MKSILTVAFVLGLLAIVLTGQKSIDNLTVKESVELSQENYSFSFSKQDIKVHHVPIDSIEYMCRTLDSINQKFKKDIVKMKNQQKILLRIIEKRKADNLNIQKDIDRKIVNNN